MAAENKFWKEFNEIFAELDRKYNIRKKNENS